MERFLQMSLLAMIAVAVAATAQGQPLSPVVIHNTNDVHANGANVGANGAVYVYGGDRGGSKTQALERYDAVGNTWTQLASTPPALSGFGKFALGGGLYLVGGEGPPGFFRDEVYRYDVTAGTWTQKSDFPTRIWDPCHVVNDGKAHLIGGRHTYGGTYNHVYAYDETLDTWGPVAPLPVSLMMSQPASYGGEIWLFGGYHKPSEPSGTLLTDIRVYNPTADAWRSEGNMPVTLSHPTAVTWEDRIWVFSPGVPDPSTGGTDPNPYAYEFDPATGAWTPHAFTPPVEWGPLNGVPVVDGWVYFTQAAGGAAAFRVAVPEPTGLLLLAVGVAELLRRRR